MRAIPVVRFVAWAAVVFAAAAPGIARADCESDCSSAYETAMAACKQANPDPGQLDALEACMDQAQETYGACVEQCQASSVD